MKKAVFISLAALAALHGADMSNKSLIKNRANIAEDNGGVYGNQMYIYKDTVETQREINAQSRNKNTPISVASPTIDRDAKVRGVNVLVEGGNLNVIGRNADVNIASPNIVSNSGVKEINVATNIQNVNLLANKNNAVNIAAPTVSGNNQLAVINTNSTVGSINTAANQNMSANISSVDALSTSASTVKSITTNVTIDGAVKVNNGTTLNVGAVSIGSPKTTGSSSQSRNTNGVYEIQPLSNLPVLTNVNTSGSKSGMAYTGEGTTNGGIDSVTGKWIGNGVPIQPIEVQTNSKELVVASSNTSDDGLGHYILHEIYNGASNMKNTMQESIAMYDEFKDVIKALLPHLNTKELVGAIRQATYNLDQYINNKQFITTGAAYKALYYAKLAEQSYSDDVPDGYKALPSFHIKGDDSKTSGLQAATYQDEKTGKIVISFRGTEFSKVNDVATSLIGIGLNDSVNAKAQFDEALWYYKIIKAKYSNNEVELTGHSLGGALAQYVGAVTGATTYAFNPAAVPDNIYQGKQKNASAENITIIRSAFDPVSAASTIKGSDHLTSNIVNVATDSFDLMASHDMKNLISGLTQATKNTRADKFANIDKIKDVMRKNSKKLLITDSDSGVAGNDGFGTPPRN